MIRTIQQFVIGTALLTLFLSMSAANAQAAAGPCDTGDGQLDVAVCADFFAYVRDSIVAGNESVAAFIPESTMEPRSPGYAHNWDANPVAYIPESTVMRDAPHYIPNWDDNSVAYIPESTMESRSLRYAHDWDANPVAYIPESTMDISLEEIFGFLNVDR